MVVINIDVGGFGATTIGFATCRYGVDAIREHSLDNFWPCHIGELRGNVVFAGSANGFGHLRGVNEHFGGDAANIEAGAAEFSFFNDSDRFIVKFWSGDGIA